MAEDIKWEIHIGYPDTLGGRALRRQVVRERSSYLVWNPKESQPPREERPGLKRGLLLPFLQINLAAQEKYLPKVALSLQKAREFDRTVLLLQEPLPEVLELLARHQAKGLKVAAVCAGAGQLYGAESPGELPGAVEELLSALQERLFAGSLKKRLLLPYGEKEKLFLTYLGDLASAALFVLRHDGEEMPLQVEGTLHTYGEVATSAAEAAGFAGRLQFGKGKLPKAQTVREGFRLMQGHALYPLTPVLGYLLQVRRRGPLSLSACVIMRDNEADIGRCLKSLGAADEIIVVDTGSVDKSVEIAGEYTDKIYHFKWIDDFAAAKNFAMSKAKGDWLVFPDSDEFFTEETAPNLKRIAEDYDWPGVPRALSVRHANVNLSLQVMGTEGAVLRFWTRGIEYAGAIHEHLEYQGSLDGFQVLDVPRDMALMLHTGYAPERMAAKTRRNMEMMEKEKREGKEVPLYHYYRARGLFAAGDYREAREEILLQYHSEERPGALQAEIYRLWYRTSQALGDQEAMEEARAAMEKDMPLLPDSYALKGVALWNEGQEEEAAPLLLKALELSGQFLEANPQEIDQVGMDMPKIGEALLEFYQQRGDEKALEKIRNILT